ncbi:hypothetical protein [Blastococcus sp. CT_GayMR19]|uniref:hypothetical protein n=1 Tax=Blastococcus sp. CT_GayMR19 TaxID=2559608 RepID=UPI001ADDC5A5|nr:hypothetical protein [Blastococcus sp. CT_GayMR19]
MRARRQLFLPSVLVAVTVALPSCTADDRDPEAASSSAELSEPPGAAPAASDPAPAAPDPAPAAPDPAPAAPDPAPAAPDPAPAAPAPAPRGEAALPLPGSRATAESVSPLAAACTDVLDALTEAVIRYEVVALAEAAGSGSRAAASADMLTHIERARTAASSQGGLPSAAAPAINAVIALRGGLDSRATLDEEDAAPWRGVRDDLQSWCQAQD